MVNVKSIKIQKCLMGFLSFCVVLFLFHRPRVAVIEIRFDGDVGPIQGVIGGGDAAGIGRTNVLVVPSGLGSGGGIVAAVVVVVCAAHQVVFAETGWVIDDSVAADEAGIEVALEGVGMVVVCIFYLRQPGAVPCHGVGRGTYQVAVAPLQRPSLYKCVGAVIVYHPVL